jgi:hypothetical protein
MWHNCSSPRPNSKVVARRRQAVGSDEKGDGMLDPDPSSPGRSALAHLVDEMARTAREGWPPTFRMMALLLVAATAVSLILMTSR